MTPSNWEKNTNDRLRKQRCAVVWQKSGKCIRDENGLVLMVFEDKKQ